MPTWASRQLSRSQPTPAPSVCHRPHLVSAAPPNLATLLLYPPSWIVDNDVSIADDRALLSAGDRAILASKIEALLEFDGRDELSAIRCPTLIVAAEDDMTIPSYFSRALAAAIGDSRLSILASGGHYHPITRAQEFVSIIGPFLARIFHTCR
jgi:aminoacrylate hydrolase